MAVVRALFWHTVLWEKPRCMGFYNIRCSLWARHTPWYFTWEKGTIETQVNISGKSFAAKPVYIQPLAPAMPASAANLRRCNYEPAHNIGVTGNCGAGGTGDFLFCAHPAPGGLCFLRGLPPCRGLPQLPREHQHPCINAHLQSRISIKITISLCRSLYSRQRVFPS